MGESSEVLPSHPAKVKLHTYQDKQRHYVAKWPTVQWPPRRAYLLFIKPSRVTAWWRVCCQTNNHHLIKISVFLYIINHRILVYCVTVQLSVVLYGGNIIFQLEIALLAKQVSK